MSDKRKEIIRKLKGYPEPELCEATDGEEFMMYAWKEDGEKVPAGNLIGIDAFNPRTKCWETLLFSDIRTATLDEEIEWEKK